MSKTPSKQDTCHSYNGDFGNTPEVKLKMLTSILPDGTREYRDVMIDACIADVVKHLWENGINTGGSCCGHGKTNPSIVLGEGVENYGRVRKLIKEKDSRYYDLSQWKRVIV